MRLKLKITNLSFEGEVEVLRDFLPMVGELVAGAITGDAAAALTVASPAIAEQSLPSEADATAEPAKDEPKPRKAYKPRKAKPAAATSHPAAAETVESTGPLRVNTGRRASEETVEALRKHGPCSGSDLAKLVGCSAAAAYQRLSQLMAKGLVQNIGRGQYQVVEE